MSVQNRIRTRKLRLEAEGYLELGMPRHALQALGRLGDPALFDAESLCLWGEGLQEMGRFLEALLPLERAARLSPDNVRVNLALGWCYKRVGRLDLAVGALERSLKSNPGEALLHYNLACYLSLAGLCHKAMAHLARALAMKPIFSKLVNEESDFDRLRADPQFQAICEEAEGHGFDP